MSTTYYHMCPTDVWASCLDTNTSYYPPTYTADGFIHLTADPALLIPVANQFYTQDPGQWIVLCIDASKLTSEVKFELAAPVGERPTGNFSKAGEDTEPLFPHLYGTIDHSAVFKTMKMQRTDDGKFAGIEGL